MIGKLIVLNGTSSAGKTTTARLLQEALEEDFMYISIDNFMQSMPRRFAVISEADKVHGYQPGFIFKYSDAQLVDIHITKKGMNIMNLMYELVKMLCYLGVNVILDDMIFNDSIKKTTNLHFSELRKFQITVYCHPDERLTRERERGDRVIGTYMIGADFINTSKYDYFLDNTGMKTPHIPNNLFQAISNYF
jgi:chloramphenicol 3-O phosphotransferase